MWIVVLVKKDVAEEPKVCHVCDSGGVSGHEVEATLQNAEPQQQATPMLLYKWVVPRDGRGTGAYTRRPPAGLCVATR